MISINHVLMNGLFLFILGYDMSTFVRRYSNYLNEKASSYRVMGYDFCRVKRGYVKWEVIHSFMNLDSNFIIVLLVVVEYTKMYHV